MNTRDKIHSAINEHLNIDDTYAYFLTRIKEAFSVGTVTIDDFEEWTDDDVADLVDSIMEKISINLNSNQQIVLEWLKEEYTINDYPLLYVGAQTKLSSYDLKTQEAYNELNKDEEFQVLAAFAEWGMKEVAE